MPHRNMADRFSFDLNGIAVGLKSIGALITFVVALLVETLIGEAVSSVLPLPQLVSELLFGLPVAVLLYVLYIRYAADLTLEECRITRVRADVLGWLAFGIVLATVVLVANAVVQRVSVVDVTTEIATAVRYTVVTLSFAVVTATVEEFAFRGILQRLLEYQWNRLVGFIVPSALFALFHTGRPQTTVTLVSTLGVTFLAGILLALVVDQTGSLWNAIAVHVAWNSINAGRIISITSAGDEARNAIIQTQSMVGSEWLSGGEAGFSSTPLTVAILAGAIAIFYVVLWRSDGSVGRPV